MLQHMRAYIGCSQRCVGRSEVAGPRNLLSACLPGFHLYTHCINMYYNIHTNCCIARYPYHTVLHLYSQGHHCAGWAGASQSTTSNKTYYILHVTHVWLYLDFLFVNYMAFHQNYKLFYLTILLKL